MKFKVWLFSGIVALTSGRKDDKSASAVIETDINILVVDKDGNNVLKGNRYSIDKIKLYYIVHDKKEEVYDGNRDIPRNIIIGSLVGGKYNGEPFLRVFANDVDKNKTTVTLLQWDENEVDTLATQIHRLKGSIFVSDIWFNGQLYWNQEIGKKHFNTGEVLVSRFITIVK